MSLELRECFSRPLLNVMNFLNEVVLRYPDAVSFAPGRPAEEFFDVEESFDDISHYVDHMARRGASREAVFNDLGQYNRTNGIIQDLVAEHLAKDEGIEVASDALMITSGCQEAMAIVLMGLFEPGRDVLLSSDPTYIGITGLAEILGIRVQPVPSGEHGVTPEALEAAIAAARDGGGEVRAFYDVPDFNNPLGTSMPPAARRRVLEIVHRKGLLLFEDNPYGMFAYDGEPLPTLKSHDEHRDVLYMGTFSKTLYPGLRIGYLVADQEVTTPDGPVPLAVELSKIKSLTTVNTPPLLQAAVGGVLLRHEGSLREVVRPKVDFYRRNRDRMLECLEQELGREAGGVSWNRPAGGFFLTVNLPFDFDQECLEVCARDHGVICCPMSFFALSAGRERQVRLSFSYVTPESIEVGVKGFCEFIRSKLG